MLARRRRPRLCLRGARSVQVAALPRASPPSLMPLFYRKMPPRGPPRPQRSRTGSISAGSGQSSIIGEFQNSSLIMSLSMSTPSESASDSNAASVPLPLPSSTAGAGNDANAPASGACSVAVGQSNKFDQSLQNSEIDQLKGIMEDAHMPIFVVNDEDRYL